MSKRGTKQNIERQATVQIETEKRAREASRDDVSYVNAHT